MSDLGEGLPDIRLGPDVEVYIAVEVVTFLAGMPGLSSVKEQRDVGERLAAVLRWIVVRAAVADDVAAGRLPASRLDEVGDALDEARRRLAGL